MRLVCSKNDDDDEKWFIRLLLLLLFFCSIFVIDLIYMLIIHNLCVGFFVLVFPYDRCVCVCLCYVWLQKSIDDIYSWPKLCCCCWNCLATLIFSCHVFWNLHFFFSLFVVVHFIYTYIRDQLILALYT